MLSLARAHHDHSTHRLRSLACIAAALLLVGLVFRLWPAPGPDLSPPRVGSEPDRLVAMEEIVQTTQAQMAAPPPPPPPTLPPVEAEEIEIEELELSLEAPLPIAPPSPKPADPVEGADKPSQVAQGPTRGPQRVRGGQPEYPREAKRRGIEAEVRLRVMVEPNGAVTEMEIIDRKLIEGERRTTVAELGYGLEKAALDAAREWRFRPALENGQRVRQEYTLTMSFGTRR